MPKILLLLILAIACVAAGPTPDERRAQISAATNNAVDALLLEISRQDLTPSLTVSQLLHSTKGHSILRGTLQRAEQIGGPRWVDENTCQIKLEISGMRVAAALSQIAASNPDKITVPPQVIQHHLKAWDNRTFAATGSSTGAGAAEEVIPTADAWARVPDEARRAAVIAARDNAIERVMTSIRPVELSEGKTLADALNQAPATLGAGMESYLARRPVTSIAFRDDLNVELVISVLPHEFFDLFRNIAAPIESLPLPKDQAGWDRVRNDFVGRLEPAVGVGRVPEPSTRPLAPALARMERVPAWIDRQIDASGTTTTAANNLRARQAARAAALANLEAQIQDLPYDDNVTLGQAAQNDPRVREAINRALNRARTYKSIYDPAGTMTVHVALELRDVWEELRQI